jgi:hypothetical protein
LEAIMERYNCRQVLNGPSHTGTDRLPAGKYRVDGCR